MFGPVIVAVGPDGIVHPDEYMPVGFFVLVLFTPAFALGVFVLPQYIAYAVAAYLFIQFCLYLSRKHRVGPRAAA